MKSNVARDIVPIGEFKTHASEMLRTLEQTGRPLVITQHGKPQAVVVTPEELEELSYRRNVREKIDAGIRSAELGKAWSLHARVPAEPNALSVKIAAGSAQLKKRKGSGLNLPAPRRPPATACDRGRLKQLDESAVTALRRTCEPHGDRRRTASSC